ncbi:MAG: Ig-like domain-containing protein [Bacteroidales bacterium]|nr:Ig-like domain-containing protein [Bacteroidales bacterium]
MKRNFISILSALAASAAVLFSCNSPFDEGSSEKIKGVELTPSELYMNVGDIQTMSFDILPSNYMYDSFAWGSEDETVATVSKKGVVTAVAEGSTNITLTVDGYVAKCPVTVVIPVFDVESVSIKDAVEGAIAVDQGSTKQLAAVIAPDNASNKKVSWASSDTGKATVDENGLVSFSSSATGSVTITVTTEDGGFTASQTFYVKSSAKLYKEKTDRVIAGRKTGFEFNAEAYPSAAQVKWTIEGKIYEGTSVEVTFAGGGEKTVVVSAEIDGVSLSDPFTVNVDEYLCVLPLPTDVSKVHWSKNSAPVFSPDGNTVYFVSLEGQRRLFAVDLVKGEFKWNVDIMENNWATNGGQFCVNPISGNVIACSNTSIFCISPEGNVLWKYTDPSAAADNCSPIMKGCGPAVSNGGNVIFAHISTGLVALNAASGNKLDELNIGTAGGVQFVVYGEDNLGIYLSGKVTFAQFKDGKFIDNGYVAANVGTTDITSGAVSSDQKKLYFSGGTSCLEIDLTLVNTETHSGGIRAIEGRQATCNSFCVLPDGYLCQTANVSAKAQVCLTNPEDLTSTYVEIGGVNTLNFTNVAADTEGHIYFFHRAATQSFYRGTRDGSELKVEKLTDDPALEQYQGAFNFANGYLVAIAGRPGKVYVRCIEANRAKTWSGRGGDICSTNNANFVTNNK